MKTVGLRGLRGGVGATSVLAMLADALHQSGQTVLMIDLNETDMLRLHFNVPFTDTTGWANAHHNGQTWLDQVFEITDGLNLVPFGRFGAHASDKANLSVRRSSLDAATHADSLHWLGELRKLQRPPDWILIDIPSFLSQAEPLDATLDLQIVVASVDVACHILLSQEPPDKDLKILANMQDPSKDLANDLILEWATRFQEQMLPVVVKRDESVHEALALKTPVTRAFPESSAAMDAQSLAVWLQLHVRMRS